MIQRIGCFRSGIALAAILLAVAGAWPTHAAPPEEARQAARVDINQATVDQLASIKGIGPALAQRIVEFREANGPFASVDDLLKVRGIGEKMLEKIRDQIVASRPRR